MLSRSIFANVNNIFGLFATHFFTNSTSKYVFVILPVSSTAAIMSLPSTMGSKNCKKIEDKITPSPWLMEIPLVRNTTCLGFPYFRRSHRWQQLWHCHLYNRLLKLETAAVDMTSENTETSDKLYFALVKFPLAKDMFRKLTRRK